MADTSDIKAMLMNEADFADEIQVVGQDQQGRRLFVDLISQQLVFPRKMIQINSNRSVDSNSAYAAIEDAFAENQEAITRAELIIE
ncbi:MAG: hypothetical protein DI585_01475 [Pseudomonas fluorescens]|nr:MAG: hypothetical protein DI585_01475 [Pseudomonas fluorescens]